MSFSRDELIKAMAASDESAHPEDREAVEELAALHLDNALEYLAAHVDEWSGAAMRRHPFGKGPVSTPLTVIQHAIAALEPNESIRDET